MAVYERSINPPEPKYYCYCEECKCGLNDEEEVYLDFERFSGFVCEDCYDEYLKEYKRDHMRILTRERVREMYE